MPSGPSSLADLWEEHRRSPFPTRLREADVDGVDLVTLDAGVAGCVRTVLAGGRLGPDDTGLLRDAEAALGGLGTLDEQERAYVERLRTLAALTHAG
ncbi:hypothetical protein SAMN05660690_3420 [Geodermatophilus telluris]|uniref:Uncharacterized protein n=1 Tax=Geodermatophilus telluris TaxID=1190417 RepID=A0A1G6S221_9ACTN|nr:hypothetical protein [Geodermatophilus telluris]SDD10962.1 hypothetical protein SAMN05660690_3420 [Geodermatophilus telluris]